MARVVFVAVVLHFSIAWGIFKRYFMMCKCVEILKQGMTGVTEIRSLTGLPNLQCLIIGPKIGQESKETIGQNYEGKRFSPAGQNLSVNL